MEQGKNGFGKISQEGSRFTYKIHGDDYNNSFKNYLRVEESVKQFLNMDFGESIMLPAKQLNSFCKVTESMNCTEYSIIPMNGELRRLIYPSINKNDFCYIIIKVPNNENYSIKEMIVDYRCK